VESWFSAGRDLGGEAKWMIYGLHVLRFLDFESSQLGRIVQENKKRIVDHFESLTNVTRWRFSCFSHI
jgi:hypothetical protein